MRFTQGRGAGRAFSAASECFRAKNAQRRNRTDAARRSVFRARHGARKTGNGARRLRRKNDRSRIVVRRVRQARFDLDFICTQAEKNYVYWLEQRGRGMFLRASPIDVSTLLQEKLFDKVETVVMTSATLSTNGKFDFIKDRLGLETAKTETLLAPSSFDYEKQAIIYLPKAMPDPRSPRISRKWRRTKSSNF